VTQGEDHIQAGRWASHLGEARLHVRRTPTGDVVVDSIHTSTFEVATRSASEKVRTLVAAEHEEVRAYVNAPIVALAEAWTSEDSRRLDTPIIDLIHHVQLKATGADLSAASAFNTSAQFAPPVLKRRDLSSLYPFQNTLYVLEITGKQLREFLDFTSRYYLVSTVKDSLVVNREWAGFNFDSIAGAEYALDLRKEPGRRLTHLRVKGREVRNTDTFTLAVNSYRAEGGGGFTMLAGAPVSFKSTKSVRELMEEELRRVDTLRIADIHTRNWSLVY
jgi:2',3'-cyclic-nucleotide 2'-phosphodiesterase/3'-nucleotidase